MTFSDTIETTILSGEICKIVYLSDGNQVIINERLEDLVWKGGDEFLVLASGMEIRLDHVVQVNNAVSPNLC